MQELYIKDSANHRGVPIIREQSHDILVEYIQKYKPERILEIGTAVGYSAMEMLKNCDGEIITIEHNENLVKEATQNLKDANLLDRATLVCDDCLVQVAQMVALDNYNEYFDFIFLDGPKAQYGNMIEGLIMLLKSGGVILVDNVLFRGYVDGSAQAPTKRFKTIVSRLRKFIDEFLNNPELENAKLIEIEDGMLFATKK